VYLLDSDILIDVQRGHPPAVEWFSRLTETPAVPGLVVMELIQAARDANETRKALRLVAPFPVFWPGEADCTRALNDFSSLRLSTGLGLLDALIGATAVGYGATLCTFNVKHYRAIPGLALEQPYRR